MGPKPGLEFWYKINERVFSQFFFVSEAEAYLVPNAHEKGRDFMPYFQAIPRSDLFVDVNTSFSCHYGIIPSKRWVSVYNTSLEKQRSRSNI